MSEAKDSQRLDKWLFFARVLKSREKAQALIKEGHVRLNGKRTDSPAQLVRPGDVLTISLERRISLLRVLAPGNRRGPAEEARLLYEEAAEPVNLPRIWP